MTRSTIVILTKRGLSVEELNTLIDKAQGIPGVFSVSLTNVGLSNPNQLPLWPDEPVEQKLLQVKS